MFSQLSETDLLVKIVLFNVALTTLDRAFDFLIAKFPSDHLKKVHRVILFLKSMVGFIMMSRTKVGQNESQSCDRCGAKSEAKRSD
jgi:hypothetical protein